MFKMCGFDYFVYVIWIYETSTKFNLINLRVKSIYNR